MFAHGELIVSSQTFLDRTMRAGLPTTTDPGRDVLGHDAAGTNGRAPADGDPGQEDDTGAEKDVLLDPNRFVDRCQIAEPATVRRNRVIAGDEVAVRAHRHVRTDEDLSGQDASLAYATVRPDDRLRAEPRLGVDVGGGGNLTAEPLRTVDP